MLQGYDYWWQEGDHGDQEMEDSHLTGWQKVIALIDAEDIRDRNVLDFGCNQGGFLRVLYDAVPFAGACGMDLARKAIEVARERAGQYPVEYFHTGDAASLNRTFHTVVSTSVLYLIENLDGHFGTISHVLEDGGVYYASFADQSRNPSLDYMKEKIDRYGATKMQNMTLTEVVDKLIEHGFSVELRKEHTEPVYEVTDYKAFYLSVDDYLSACNNSYLIKAVKTNGQAAKANSQARQAGSQAEKVNSQAGGQAEKAGSEG